MKHEMNDSAKSQRIYNGYGIKRNGKIRNSRNNAINFKSSNSKCDAYTSE